MSHCYVNISASFLSWDKIIHTESNICDNNTWTVPKTLCLQASQLFTNYLCHFYQLFSKLELKKNLLIIISNSHPPKSFSFICSDLPTKPLRIVQTPVLAGRGEYTQCRDEYDIIEGYNSQWTILQYFILLSICLCSFWWFSSHIMCLKYALHVSFQL